MSTLYLTQEQQAQLADAFIVLVQTVAKLRAPDGCPWDREQTHLSIARNVTEEAAEVVDAIETENLPGMVEELGDLLLQVMLQSQIAYEADEFALIDVTKSITDKLVRRHPHVFGIEAVLDAMSLSDEKREALATLAAGAESAEAVLELWDNIKLLERESGNAYSDSGDDDSCDGTDSGCGGCGGSGNGSSSGSGGSCGSNDSCGDGCSGSDNSTSGITDGDQNAAPAPAPSLLDSVPNALPALMQAQDISRKAIAVGFDFEGIEGVWRQVEAEIAEFKAEASGSSEAADEMGDVIFSIVNIALKSGIDAESALRSSVRRFRQRWAIMERYARQEQRELSSYSTEQLEQFWQQAKQELREQLAQQV
jgi:uncharacterized protein YabN with tetrapyrrole methylase and pyrophosphatase domain